MFVMVRDGKLPGVPPAQLSFAHVAEVVSAHIAAADRGTNGGQYILAGENRSMLDLVTEISLLLGKPAPKGEMPAWLLKIVAYVGDVLSNFTGKEPAITPEIANGLGGSFTVTSAKAQKELGYKVVPLKVMVKDCYDWMKAEGRI
jgi:nucleoside-diphosphate-sugar epimerase